MENTLVVCLYRSIAALRAAQNLLDFSLGASGKPRFWACQPCSRTLKTRHSTLAAIISPLNLNMPKMYPLIALAIFAAACMKPVIEAPAPASPIGAPTSFAAAMLAEVNALRQAGCRCGSRQMPPAPPLQWNSLLAQAAQRHADDMRRNRFFDHDGSDGSTMSSRISAAGYSWSSVAENIAWGYDDIPSVVRGWRDSPGHCQNIMSKDYTEMGAAQAGTYWVQTFGRRR